MSMLSRLTICTAISIVAPAAAQSPQFGQPTTPADVSPWDISIGPDGIGLPPGRGTAIRGAEDAVHMTAGHKRRPNSQGRSLPSGHSFMLEPTAP